MIRLNKKYIDLFFNKSRTKDSKYYKELYNYLNQSYIDITPKYTIQELPINIKLNVNQFMSNNIKRHITNLKYYHLLEAIINNNKVTIHIYHSNNIDEFVRIILTYIQFMYNLSNYNKDIFITYYLTNCKKILKNKILTQDEVNTGSSNMHEIIIWRKEEVYKTTIHELIHQMNLDYRDDPIEIIKYYQNKYNCISGTINTFEAYTDMWAILINVYLTTKLLNNNYKFFVEMINLEKLFTLYQGNKILVLNNNYNKHTNVLAYYVLKAELFQSLPKVLKFLNNKIKLDSVDNYFQFLMKLPKLKEVDYKIKTNTLRMSITEIN